MIVVLAVLALLFQSAFVIACDMHDVGHAISSSADGYDIGCKDAADGQAEPLPPDTTEDQWHEVFALGHCMTQIFQSVNLHSLLELQLPDADLPMLSGPAILAAPLNSPLRPPIRG